MLIINLLLLSIKDRNSCCLSHCYSRLKLPQICHWGICTGKYSHIWHFFEALRINYALYLLVFHIVASSTSSSCLVPAWDFEEMLSVWLLLFFNLLIITKMYLCFHLFPIFNSYKNVVFAIYYTKIVRWKWGGIL
jgi:hypothetical protein